MGSKLKQLVWEPEIGSVAKTPDVRALIINQAGTKFYYHVYQGVELTKFFWWFATTSGAPNVKECSSIEEGQELAQADYNTKQEQGTFA